MGQFLDPGVQHELRALADTDVRGHPHAVLLRPVTDRLRHFGGEVGRSVHAPVVDTDFDAGIAQIVVDGDLGGGLLGGGDQRPHRMIGVGACAVAPGHVDVVAHSHNRSCLRLRVHLFDPVRIVRLAELGQHAQFPNRGYAVIGPGPDSVLPEFSVVHRHMDVRIDKGG